MLTCCFRPKSVKRKDGDDVIMMFKGSVAHDVTGIIFRIVVVVRASASLSIDNIWASIALNSQISRKLKCVDERSSRDNFLIDLIFIIYYLDINF